MVENFSVIVHSAIRIISKNQEIIYFDPFKLDNKFNQDADYIFVTHSHYDHFSPEDILEIKKEQTKIVVPKDLKREAEKLGFSKENILLVVPNENYNINQINIETVPAYNINKDFHKKKYNWVGYIITVDDTRIYVAGDTDNTEEAQNVKCDIAFVPIGGTYTMTYNEAAELIRIIKPTIAVPIHYGKIVGSEEDAMDFKEMLKNEDIKVEILI